MFANINNGLLAKRNFVLQTRKKICESFLKILWDEGFILGYTTDLFNKNKLKIFLKYEKNKPAITSIKIISRPGRKIYWTVEQIWKIDSTKNFIILSTNKGLLTLTRCKKLNIGGEPVLIIN